MLVSRKRQNPATRSDALGFHEDVKTCIRNRAECLGGKRIVRCPINPDHAFESVPSILQKDLYLLTPELKNGFGTEPIRGFGKKIQQEIDMSKIIRAALVAAALLTGATAAIADTVPDQSDQYGGYDHNSQEGTRAFWEQQTRHGN